MTDAATLLDLAERCETAEALRQRELLQAARNRVFSRVNPRALNMTQMINVGAFESAAMLLLPAGYGWRLWMPNSTSIEPPRVTMWGNERTYPPTDSEAETAALALTAASLRARAATETNDAR